MSENALHAKLTAAGLPVVSVRKMLDGTYAAVLTGDATDEQRAQAAQLIATQTPIVEAEELALQQRMADDSTEAAQAKADAQIQTDLNRTRQNISNLIDTIFPTFTTQQRAFLERLTVLSQTAARKVLR